METEYEPYVVRTSWEGVDINTTTHVYRDDAEREYDERVKHYLNLPDMSLAEGSCIQLIHGFDIHREYVA